MVEIVTDRYKDTYRAIRALKDAFQECLVMDQYYGLGWTTYGQGHVVWVEPSLSYKEKCMILAHEFGHWAKYSQGVLIPTTNGRSEDEAHETALAILRDHGIGELEYAELRAKARKLWR